MEKLHSFDKPVTTSKGVEKNIKSFKSTFNTSIEQLHFFSGVDIYKTGRTIDDIDNISDEVVCTTYFTTKADPQRKIIIENNSIDYIAPWYNSIKKLNLFGIVFHDGLSDEFIEEYETDNIKFVSCTLGNYSLNDERFIIYYMFFMKYKVRQLLFTDGNDVVVNKNPFNFFTTKRKETIFIGRGKENKIYQSAWNLSSINKLSTNLQIDVPNNFFEMAIYNAGIIGGDYYTVMYFLRQMNIVLLHINKDDNNNMAVMHYVLYNFFYPNCRRGFKAFIYSLTNEKLKVRILNKFKKMKWNSFLNNKIKYNRDIVAVSKFIFSGYPLHSKFYKFEENSGAFIIHK